MRNVVLQVTEVGQATRRVDLLGPMLVGRDAAADLRIRHDDCVSRRHLRLRPALGGAHLEVLGTTNVTLVDNEPLQPGTNTIVPDGATIRIGGTLLVVEAKGAESTHVARGPAALKRPPSTVLVPQKSLEEQVARSAAWILVKGTGTRRRRSQQLLCSQVEVGSALECGYVLAHDSVSPRHARLRFNGFEWEIQDLGSKNGTWVGGRGIGTQTVRLQCNTLVGFGSVQGVFVCREERAAAARARTEAQALRYLVERGRLTSAEVEMIANRTAGGSAAYQAAILINETDIKAEEWIGALDAQQKQGGIVSRIKEWLQFDGS